MSQQAMFSMSSDFSALTSAMETGKHSCELLASDDVISCSQVDRVQTFSDSGIASEPSSPIPDGKDNGMIGIQEDTAKKSPGLSYIALISMAIQSCPEKRMLLSEIYQWISDKYPYYNMKEKSWRNSIRHNLSLNECFVKNGRSENGKGNYWSIHPANIEDFSNGDFRRRRARRRVRKCDEDLKRLCTRSPYTSSPPPSSENSSTSNDGYIPMASTAVPTNFLSSLGIDNKNHDEWNFHNFPYQTNTTYKPYDLNFYPRDVCSQYFPYQHSDSYSGLYTPESSKHHVTRPTPASGELNVNVNVNVCGNTGSSRQYVSPQSPSCYVPSQSFRQPFQVSSYDEQANSISRSGSGHAITTCMYNPQGQAMGINSPSHDKE